MGDFTFLTEMRDLATLEKGNMLTSQEKYIKSLTILSIPHLIQKLT